MLRSYPTPRGGSDKTDSPLLHGDDLVAVEAAHLELPVEVAHRQRHQLLVIDAALHQRR